MKNRLVFPMEFLKVTQNYTGSLTHKKHTYGGAVDYPIDIAGYDSGRDYVYCPCDEMVVTRIYGLNNSKKSNTIWLTSTAQVNFADGTEDFVTMSCTHPNDEDLKNYGVGTKFKRGQAMFREGTDGNATGNHIHLAVGKGSMTGNGWVQNANGSWVLTTSHGTIKPEQAFYIDRKFTSIITFGGLVFKDLPRNPYVKPNYRMKQSTHCYSQERTPSEGVKWIQYELQRLGYYTGKIDGWYGPKTTAAVWSFQEDYRGKTYVGAGNTIDGKTGPLTITAMENS